MARKIYLAFLFLIPQVLWAQLRYDSLLSRYAYQCNCSESLIVKGTPVETKYHTKQKDVKLFAVEIDTVYYARGIASNEIHIAFILSSNTATTKSISESNLFVLKQCFYCDPVNHINCRPLLYFELVSAAKTESMTLDITNRQNMIPPCVDCQAIRPIQRKSLFPFKRKQKWDIYELNKIEKYIEKNDTNVGGKCHLRAYF